MDVTLLRSRASLERLSPVMTDLVFALDSRGARVTHVHPEELEARSQPLRRTDVCVLKAKTTDALRLGRRYHEAGIPTISPYPVTALCRDKLATNLVLEASGLPVPACVSVTQPDDVLRFLAEGPVILKPVRGSRGRGIRVVRGADDVPEDLGEEETLAQRYVAPDGLDRKIYRIGEEVFCVVRVWPPVTLQDKYGRLMPLDPATEEIARACGDVLGTDVYGVDIVEHEGRPWVVDLSSFPGFKGVPDAGVRLAERIMAAA
ncbi:MAG: ATP-grasp domain-containing protein [Propionibacteriaceae bacterium]|nr:ATP-grasp domain-containing protein [Propionibacteriaceae bacterium]